MAIWIFGNFIVYQASMAYFRKAGHTYGIYKKACFGKFRAH